MKGLNMERPETAGSSRGPEYEEDFGHQIEEVIASFINDNIPGMHCEKATKSEDLTEATDTWLVLEEQDKRIPLQITMTSNKDMLARKEKRGPLVIYVPKSLIRAGWNNWEEFISTHEESIEFNYEFLPQKAQEIIVKKLTENPEIKRYMLTQANRRVYN